MATNDALPQIFDRHAYALRRSRALRRGGDKFLAVEAASRIAERISMVNRHFQNGLELSARPETAAVLAPCASRWVRSSFVAGYGDVIADEEALPFGPAKFDLVVSVLSLHAVNDLPGALVQIHRALKPDGLFMAALFTSGTLSELRDSFTVGESETIGGITPHIAPFADLRDLGTLLQRARFGLPVADVEHTEIVYRSFDRLIADLRDLGETNTLADRRKTMLPRGTLGATIAHYTQTHGAGNERLRASFEICYLLGWAPHESQQKPLRPGSAKMRLADALGVAEHSTGIAANPNRPKP